MDDKEKEKLSEDFKPDTEVFCEIEKVEDPKENPFKKGKVLKINFPSAKAKNQEVTIEVEIDEKHEKFAVQKVSRICQDDNINVNDMAEVSPINTKDLLTNIHNRYDQNEIFTAVGETLIIVNPYYIIPGLYTEEKMKEIVDYSNDHSDIKYARKVPHCFDTTMNTIFDLISTNKNQALVISGESGAGKTECAKLCMKFIVYYFRKKEENSVNDEVSLEDKILDCNPVLEAFGNSKTVRNDNSSRFGKYIKIFINTITKQIVGAFMETYLLEKSRVVSLAPGERNYHIFYQIILGINFLIKANFDYEKVYTMVEDMKIKLSGETKKYIKENLTAEQIKSLFIKDKLEEIKLESFHYLKNDVYDVPTINDVANFYECINGLVNTGFSNQEINYVIKIVVSILWIGNIEFEPEKSGDKCQIKESSKSLQKKICEMLSIDFSIFEDAFIYNVRIIKGETIKSPMELKDCESFRDTFSKEIYNRLFSYLVKKMNATLLDVKIQEEVDNNDDIKHIGLLDIFGFECFNENSFEQFCINYANEKLQNLYIEDIFKEIEQMFIREGLKEHFCQIEYKDNTVILDAMGKYPSGIFFQLDNECNVGQKDMNLLSRILSTLKTNISIKSSLKNKEKFFIIHTAKDVEYNILGFCVKNLDEFKLRMIDSINSISDAQTTEMIGENAGEERHKKEKYLGGKFRTDMDNLAKALRQCVRHYIRCLKPNELKKKNCFVPWFSLLQIKYMGVLDTIKIRQEGFPIIKTYYEFYMKYEDAVDFAGKLFYKEVNEEEHKEKLKGWTNTIVQTLLPDYPKEDILFGKTVVLMRLKMSDKLELARKNALLGKERMVTLIANKIRGTYPKEIYSKFYYGIFTLQQNYKLYEFIRKMNKIREIARMLQRQYRIKDVQNSSNIFKAKLARLKKLFNFCRLKINNKKNIIKVLTVKYKLQQYAANLRQQKLIKYRKTVKDLISKSIYNYIRKTLEPNVIYIQKNVRGFLAKINLGEIYDMIKQRRLVLKEDISCRKIQTNFRRHLAMQFVKKQRIAKDKFISLIKYHRFQTWYKKARPAAIKIQRAFMRKYLKRKIIENRLKEFTEEEDNKFVNSTLLSNVNLFPERKFIEENNENLNDINNNNANNNITGTGKVDGISGTGTSSQNQIYNNYNREGSRNIKNNIPGNAIEQSEMKDTFDYGPNINGHEHKQLMKMFYERKMKKANPLTKPEAQYLIHSIYDQPKLNFFAHILDFDPIINIDDIYTLPWTQTYQEVVQHNIMQNTPIQLIEIGDYHTTLVNTNGKTFTWGWNGNGQCAFNLCKDVEYLYENFKSKKYLNEQSKENNGNVLLRDIVDFPTEMEGGVDDAFDFDLEVQNVKDEKEIFHKNDDKFGEFKKENFEDFYYVDSPMIIDNFCVKKIVCGEDNTMVLTKDDKLYVFGANYDYQLGVLKSRNIFSPMNLVSIVKDQQAKPVVNIKAKIKELKFSGKNALLLNEEGNLIMLSCTNYNEELEKNKVDNYEILKTPIELPIPAIKFSAIECGKDFCLLLGVNGQLYSMGSNKYGQLGQGDNNPRYYPTVIKFFNDKKIKIQQISCGFKHCCALGFGKVYSWGCNRNGQLGNKGLKSENIPKYIEINYSKLKHNILQVSCGYRSSVFLTETRQLFWCGTCGDIQFQKVPIEFNYSAKIPEVFGYDFHQIIKINHTWSRTLSILYATVAETGPLKFKLNNPNKLNYIINYLSNNWLDKSLYPPVSEHFENYIGEKHISRNIKKYSN